MRRLDLKGTRPMEGPLSLVGNATAPLHAVPLQQLGGTIHAWAAFTPAVTSGSGTITTASATGRWAQVSKFVVFEAFLTITTNGSGSGSLLFTLPAKANSANVFAGVESAVTGSMCYGIVSNGGTSCRVQTYNNGYPGADGANIIVTGCYETT
jgi:hypothetical protein